MEGVFCYGAPDFSAFATSAQVERTKHIFLFFLCFMNLSAKRDHHFWNQDCYFKHFEKKLELI